MMLHEFLTSNRDAILERARAKVAGRRVPLASPVEQTDGVPLFLSQLTELLGDGQRGRGAARTSDAEAQVALGEAADAVGGATQAAGLTVAQVVEGYGDVCQAITEHAADTGLQISAEEYRTLNLSVDVATARAVTSFSASRDRLVQRHDTERLGVLAHELRNLLSTALLSYEALRGGRVGIEGNTGALLGRTLRALRDVVDRSLAEVRLAASVVKPSRVAVGLLVEELEVGAALDAATRGLELHVPAVDPALAVNADRQLLASAVANLLQNALKYTRPGGRVSLTVRLDEGEVLVEVQDQCGGLPKDRVEGLFRAFHRGESDASGLGLGLKISQDAVRASGGSIRVRDLPGEGCVFTIALPVAA